MHAADDAILQHAPLRWPERELHMRAGVVAHRDRHAPTNDQDRHVGEQVPKRGGDQVRVGGRLAGREVEVDNEIARIGYRGGQSGNTDEAGGHVGQGTHARDEVEPLATELVLTRHELPTLTLEGADLLQRADLVEATGEHLQHWLGPGASTRSARWRRSAPSR